MRRPLALAIGVLVLGGLQAPSAETICSRHCLAGCPDGAPDNNELVIRDIYILSNNPQTKFADWVAYQVVPENHRTVAGPHVEGGPVAACDVDPGT